MALVFQADIFCDAEVMSKGCSDFIEQGETYHHSPKGSAKGAWEVAKARGWTRKIVDGRYEHYCPSCTAMMEVKE